jgi:hypothetical protein
VNAQATLEAHLIGASNASGELHAAYTALARAALETLKDQVRLAEIELAEHEEQVKAGAR